MDANLTWLFSVDKNLSNNTSNSTGTNEDAYFFYQTEQFAVLSVLFISIVVGNVAVITALLLSKARKSRTNFFIMHLALADLSVGLISVLTDIVWKATVSWLAGNVACKVIRFAQELVTYSSTYVLVALSIDRYDAIVHPMNFSGSWKRAKRLILAAWVQSAIFASPSLQFFREEEINGIPQCWIDFPQAWHWKLYMTLTTLTVFIIPTIIITACYTIIVYTIWSKSKQMSIGHSITLQNGGKSGRHSVDDDSRRASSRGLIPKAKIKTVKMTLVIVFVFVLCWSPYFVFNVMQVYGYIPQTMTNNAIATFIQSLAPLNSAANPIIYCLFSTHICRNLRRIRLLDWLVQRLFPCCDCTHIPLDTDGPLRRIGTECTTMSESSTRRHNLMMTTPPVNSTTVRYNCRYSQMRQMTPQNKSFSSRHEYLNMSPLGYEKKQSGREMTTGTML